MAERDLGSGCGIHPSFSFTSSWGITGGKKSRNSHREGPKSCQGSRTTAQFMGRTWQLGRWEGCVLPRSCPVTSAVLYTPSRVTLSTRVPTKDPPFQSHLAPGLILSFLEEDLQAVKCEKTGVCQTAGSFLQTPLAS